MQKSINARPSVLRHVPSYIFSVILIIGLTVGLVYILNVDFLDQFRTVIIWSYVIVIVLILLFDIYKTLDTLLFRIYINKLGLEFRHGVIAKTVESVDMHRVKDFKKTRSLLEQILGLATIKILSTDFLTPEVRITGLKLMDARMITRFLQEYASDSIVKHYVNKNDSRAIDNAIVSNISRDRREP